VDGGITSKSVIDLNGSLTFADDSVIASANYYDAPTELQNYAMTTDLNNYATTEYINNLNSTTSVIYAPNVDPIFAGTVTFPDNTFISATTSSYVTAGNLNNILTNNYAPLIDPTFTGNVNLNGNVTLAQTSANSLTLNDHLILCKGLNFPTPVSGQQGYIATGTIVTNQTSIPTSTVTTVASITLSYGVWLIIGQGGIYNSSSAAASCVMNNKQFEISSSGTTTEGTFQNRSIGSYAAGIGVAACEQCTRVVTVTNSSTSYYLNMFVNYSAGTLLTWATQTNLYAVRLA
jgi:hypothetical protein